MEGAEDTGHMTSGQFYAGPVTGDTGLCSEPGEKTPGMTPPGPARGEIELRQQCVNNTPF